MFAPSMLAWANPRRRRARSTGARGQFLKRSHRSTGCPRPPAVGEAKGRHVPAAGFRIEAIDERGAHSHPPSPKRRVGTCPRPVFETKPSVARVPLATHHRRAAQGPGARGQFSNRSHRSTGCPRPPAVGEAKGRHVPAAGFRNEAIGRQGARGHPPATRRVLGMGPRSAFESKRSTADQPAATWASRTIPAHRPAVARRRTAGAPDPPTVVRASISTYAALNSGARSWNRACPAHRPLPTLAPKGAPPRGAHRCRPHPPLDRYTHAHALVVGRRRLSRRPRPRCGALPLLSTRCQAT